MQPLLLPSANDTRVDGKAGASSNIEGARRCASPNFPPRRPIISLCAVQAYPVLSMDPLICLPSVAPYGDLHGRTVVAGLDGHRLVYERRDGSSFGPSTQTLAGLQASHLVSHLHLVAQ